MKQTIKRGDTCIDTRNNQTFIVKEIVELNDFIVVIDTDNVHRQEEYVKQV